QRAALRVPDRVRWRDRAGPPAPLAGGAQTREPGGARQVRLPRAGRSADSGLRGPPRASADRQPGDVARLRCRDVPERDRLRPDLRLRRAGGGPLLARPRARRLAQERGRGQPRSRAQRRGLALSRRVRPAQGPGQPGRSLSRRRTAARTLRRPLGRPRHAQQAVARAVRRSRRVAPGRRYRPARAPNAGVARRPRLRRRAYGWRSTMVLTRAAIAERTCGSSIWPNLRTSSIAER